MSASAALASRGSRAGGSEIPRNSALWRSMRGAACILLRRGVDKGNDMTERGLKRVLAVAILSALSACTELKQPVALDSGLGDMQASGAGGASGDNADGGSGEGGAGGEGGASGA